MKPATTRTLNPLPFQDLEPRRFEDLVRQLAYDHRRWRSIEATGRSGSDEGIDIRAEEAAPTSENDADDQSEDQDGVPPPVPVSQNRLWIFQCKRERALGAKRVREIVEESLVSLDQPPHGFVLAVACDVSKKTRDAFREDMVRRGISEFMLWAKSELEDQLFQPRNDHLLFAYFGLSLATQRRTIAAALRREIALRRQLTALLADHEHRGRIVLLRDPTDDRYPHNPEKGEPARRWRAVRLIGLKSPGVLTVLAAEHYAALTPDHQRWDALLGHDLESIGVENELRSLQAWSGGDEAPHDREPHDFWSEYIPEGDRAFLKIFRFVSLNGVVAIDPIGDGYFPVPQIFVEFQPKFGPFTEGMFAALEFSGMHRGRVGLQPGRENRAAIFPSPLPADDAPPSGFDEADAQNSALSHQAEEKFAGILSAIETSRPRPPDPADVAAQLEASRRKVLAFEKWRDKVARPVFSAFTIRLRADGHWARVVSRSVGPDERGRDAFRSIELRVKLTVGSRHNPSYKPSGHLRISMTDYGGWRQEVDPNREESQRYASGPTGVVEAVAPEQLEAEVLALLDRLRTRGL